MSVDWPTRRLCDIADIRVSNVDKNTCVGEKSVKLCNYMDVYSNEYVTSHLEFMEASANKAEIERFSLKLGDVVITKDSETPDDIGIPAVIAEAIDNLICGYHLALIRPHATELDPVFLAKQLSTSRIARYFALHASGSTRYGLPISVIESVGIPTPPKPEQTKIAEILSTVDGAIEQTTALIAKRQRIHAGLMQDLLTRGIDEQGNLRSEQTHRFKDSPLGRLPVEWEVLPIDRVISGIDAGWSPSCEDEPPAEGEWGVLKVSAISSGVFEPSESKRLAATMRPIEAIEVFPNDVLISRANGVAELVGRCVLVEQTPEKLMLSDKTLRLNPRDGKITPFILATLVSSSPVRLQLGTLLSGSSGQKNISQKEIRSILLGLPPFDEQLWSEKYIIQSVRQIAAETRRLRKLLSLKTAFMQDLLTGKKRVTSLLEPSVQPMRRVS